MKLPIYLNENHIIDSLPPEITYSTYPMGHIKIGYIISDYPLNLRFEGVWGAFHEAPNVNGGFFSTHALIKLAFSNQCGLSWEPI